MKEKLGNFFATLIVWSILINGIVTVPWTVYLWLTEKHRANTLQKKLDTVTAAAVPDPDED